jgi:hypothetical protein
MELEEAVRNNKKIKILAYTVSKNIEFKLKEVLGFILEMYMRIDLLPALYTCVKELLVNAVKANFKNIYFEGYFNQDASSLLDYDLALRLFKLEIARNEADHLGSYAKEFGIMAEMVIQVLDDTLIISITNPVKMTEIEKKRVFKKMTSAMECADFTEYFSTNDDDKSEEGAGLGLVLVSIILKNIGIKNVDFKIIPESDKTTAYLSIPLKHEEVYLQQ